MDTALALIEWARINAHPEITFNVDCRIDDNADGNGSFIAEWNLAWPQPTPAELATVEAAALDKAAKDTLKALAERISITGQANVVDPLGSVYSPRQTLERYILKRHGEWETTARDGTTAPAVVTAIRAAFTAEQDWLEAEGLVKRKINAGVYTTARNVNEALEWP